MLIYVSLDLSTYKDGFLTLQTMTFITTHLIAGTLDSSHSRGTLATVNQSLKNAYPF